MNYITNKPDGKVISSFIEIFGENFIRRHGKQIVEVDRGLYLFEWRRGMVKLILDEIEIDTLAKFFKCRGYKYLGRWEFKNEFVNVKHDKQSDLWISGNGIDCGYNANDVANVLKIIGNVVDVFFTYEEYEAFKDKGNLILSSDKGSVFIFWVWHSPKEEEERKPFRLNINDVAKLIKQGENEFYVNKVVEEKADDNEDEELIKELEGELGITVKFPVF